MGLTVLAVYHFYCVFRFYGVLLEIRFQTFRVFNAVIIYIPLAGSVYSYVAVVEILPKNDCSIFTAYTPINAAVVSLLLNTPFLQTILSS